MQTFLVEKHGVQPAIAYEYWWNIWNAHVFKVLLWSNFYPL